MESKLILRIADQYIIDFNTDSVSINFNLKDIKEYSKKKTSFTKPLQIWQTKDTTPIFKAAFNINSDGGFDEHRKVAAELLEDGVTILRGYLYLEDIYKDYYEVVLAAADVDVFAAVGDRELSALDFGTRHQHTITKQHILDQWNAPGIIDGTGIKWTLVDFNNAINSAYGSGVGSDLQQDYSLTPTVGAKEIFEKILADNGFTYQASADILDNLKRLYIPYNGALDRFTTTYNYLKVHTATSLKSELIKNQVDLVFQTGDYEYLTNDTAATAIKIKSAGHYKFNITFTGKVSTGSENLDIKLHQYGSAYNIFAASESIALTTTNSTTTVTIECFVDQEDGLYLQFNCPNLVISSCEVVGYLHDYLYAGTTTISLNDVLPLAYKQKDFLNDLFKLFNIYTQVDKLDNRKLHLRTYEEFYAGGETLDWSSKVSSESISFRDLSSELAKNYEFTFTEDADIYNKDYKERSEKVLYSKTVKGKNELIGNTTESIKLTTAPVAIKRVNDYLRGIPVLLDKSGKRDWKPRMLFLNIWDQTGFTNKLFVNRVNAPTWNDIVNIISLSHYKETDFLSSTNLFLGFDHSDEYVKAPNDPALTNLTLYNKYYKADIEGNLYGNYKLLKASFHLNPLDVDPDNFRNLIYIKDDKIGAAYYRLNSIKNYRPGQLCEVELIKVNDHAVSYPALITPNYLDLLQHNEEEKSTVAGSGGGGSGQQVDLSEYYTKPETNTLLEGKEPAFTKNTGFNLPVGTTAGTVREGNAVFTLQETTTAGNSTNKGVVLKTADNLKQVAISLDANGNVIFNAGTNQNFHFSGDVVAFSALTPPAGDWWRAASATVLGAIKVGANLTIDANGVLSADAQATDTSGLVKKAGDTMSGKLFVPDIQVNQKLDIRDHGGGTNPHFRTVNYQGNYNIYPATDATDGVSAAWDMRLYVSGVYRKVWHEGTFNPSQYLRNDLADQFVTSNLRIQGTSTGNANISAIQFYENNKTTRKGWIGEGSSGSQNIYVGADGSADIIMWERGGTVQGRVWHAGNDGALAKQSVVGETSITTGTGGAWFRIASTSGDRAFGTFTISDEQSGMHQVTHFNAGVAFGLEGRFQLNILGGTRYGGAQSFSKFRILENTSDIYAPIYLEVYATQSLAGCQVVMTDNEWDSGWTLSNFSAGGVPTGYAAKEYGVPDNGVSFSGSLTFSPWGGGFYMQDTSWIRTFGNKNFYHNTGIMRTDGTLQVAGNGSVFRSEAGNARTYFNDRLVVEGGKMYPYTTSTRSAGMYGNYDSFKTGHIWSIGTSWGIPDDGSTFGNLYGIAYKHTNNTTGGNMAGGHQAVFTNSGTAGTAIGFAGNIWTSGWIHAGGNITAYSDQRVKTDVSTISDASDIVSKLRGVRYKRTDTELDKVQIGLIAQELKEHLPEVVEYDESVNMHSVNYQVICAVLIEAIKDLQQKVEKLEKGGKQ